MATGSDNLLDKNGMLKHTRISGNPVSLKLWHVVAVAVLQIIGIAVTVGILYGRIEEQTKENAANIERLQNAKLVGQSEFDALRDELRSDFTTLENALLNEKEAGR